MKRFHVFTASVVLFCFFAALSAPSLRRAHAAENLMFAYPHLLPSPFTLRQGVLVFGTTFGYGVTDFFQISTNVLKDFYRIYNVGAKLSFLDTELVAMALTFEYEFFNYRQVVGSGPNAQIVSKKPGIVTSWGVLPRFAVFVGGNADFTTITDTGADTSGYVQGSRAEMDFAWAYQPPTKKRDISNVISWGVSYDITYSMLGFGVSHHWPGFQLGVHYYPDATKHPIQPIIVGGGAVQL